ncbi:MAG: hypothetical protein UV61_C0024G0002 [Candidatus Gottesmanbacteria bacterium GW2011_GWB1_43_11]|uniref:DUF5673 domain-containing protein n=1 Tax=Candidatus Gottesmanbacteria bacterium GW2011_GWB1_43_11 TaxID=1618446 RepID=A0A0G1FD52_9BACT|nr:MAG: hypothetical protein UV04_C0018G0015 [Candidatus Gottesmanbacteria bacterium GW2011_GWA2_42_16]KKS54371.1 MAG: hypothetical protein UV17_C0020G0031 [Candidatus Gottesmanbacteria bacterium GW2011_GWA1_42_26]KKS80238.1 MAG: hypothetical protein UV55_C0045G0015 [Candidatus Gottesmanbacteria bacterium GW2011_GWC1_43_10]KKS84788.1 MAG: hypothetical protein UV61_C0024G0002 [Candidatus Gottesmanbacteria bacterium GW2011_GWB1_43_11]OGG10576.1 MAG: hypothetical protein A2699_03575 [Candidatus Go
MVIDTQDKPQVPTDKTMLLEWEAPSRPFQKHSHEFYRTATALVFLVVIILLFIGEFLLIGVILATYFVIYVLSTVPPETIKNKITSLGIETGDHFHKWEEMQEFWFDEKNGQSLLVIRMFLGFPSHLQLLLNSVSPDQIKKLFANKIPFREKPEITFLDRTSSWLSRKIPLERTS